MFSQFITHQVRGIVGGHDHMTEPVSIMHPEAAKAENIIHNAWADSQLVAD